MKHCCRNCHFLAKEQTDIGGGRHRDSWTKEERAAGQVNHPDRTSSFCWHGIWDTGISPELGSRLEEVIGRNRKNSCYFIEYDEDGMTFDGAWKLYKARNERRDRKRDFYFWLTGVVLTVIVAVLGLVVSENFRKFVKEIIDGLGIYIPTYLI